MAAALTVIGEKDQLTADSVVGSHTLPCQQEVI